MSVFSRNIDGLIAMKISQLTCYFISVFLFGVYSGLSRICPPPNCQKAQWPVHNRNCELHRITIMYRIYFYLAQRFNIFWAPKIKFLN